MAKRIIIVGLASDFTKDKLGRSTPFSNFYNMFRKLKVRHQDWVIEATDIDRFLPSFLNSKITTDDCFVVLLCGPKYDRAIKGVFGDYRLVDELDLGSDKFARVVFSDEDYRKMSFYRTYHPAYLQRTNKTAWSRIIAQELTNLVTNLEN